MISLSLSLSQLHTQFNSIHTQQNRGRRKEKGMEDGSLIQGIKKQSISTIFDGTGTSSGSITSTAGRVTSTGTSAARRYKFWVIFAILVLAIWSMLTGSVTLKWSSAVAGDKVPGGLFDDSPVGDLDVLELEEREKLVRRLWDVYMLSKTVRLPRFWEQAFQAGYQFLTSDVAAVRDGAFSEIAKMSFLSLDIQLPPANPNLHLKGIREKGRGKKQGGEDNKVSSATAKTSL